MNMSQTRDPLMGPGIRLTGSNAFCTVELQTSGVAVLKSGSTVYDTICITPEVLGQSIAVLATQFVMHRFLKLRFRYEPCVSTATARSIRFAYIPDAGFDTEQSAPTYLTLADCQYNWTTQVWAPCNYALTVPRTRAGYVNNYTASSATSQRDACQGLLAAQSDAAGGATLTVGAVIIDYTVEFFGKCPTMSLSLLSKRLTGPKGLNWRHDEHQDPSDEKDGSIEPAVTPMEVEPWSQIQPRPSCPAAASASAALMQDGAGRMPCPTIVGPGQRPPQGSVPPR